MLLNNSLNILCFGDSLTAGFSHVGAPDHPYGLSLQTSLRAKFPELNVTVDVQGRGGDFVISPPGQFLPRIQSIYRNYPLLSYDFAIILGGTNDLCVKMQTVNIWPALQKVWSVPLSHSTKVLAMTVPECGLCDSQFNAERDALNSLILGHETKNLYKFDYSSAIPYCSMPKYKRDAIWADHLHLTDRGYDLLGSLVADRLAEIIRALGRNDEVENNICKEEL
ncbi:GDSL-like lipase/acylhydrolase [Golovinomyces cichoracearum]|uniref:GDSL-like lipase/acylhydrolase n=1 Tax=Golovinomyces cichoracearum TaxID=62708 RepID=A0A420I0E2_9PEZI|nr:GDSL-like lipase/acylhydrolase [Golovinomyces cichoracearum]